MTVANFVLATDLDGTFLGGDAAARSALYAELRNRDDLVLIFVTGRDIDFVRNLLECPEMPRPNYIIGDVGTSIFDGRDYRPIIALERHIASLWNDAGPRISQMLQGVPGLSLQPTPFRHRLSYDYDPDTFDPACTVPIEAAGYDCLISANRFFDVLPRGVSKGPTLSRLVRALDLAPARVLVAGDTMNDLSLFEAGFKGVAVANSEPTLLAAVRDNPNVYRTHRTGAAGISDAIRHFDFTGEPKP